VEEFMTQVSEFLSANELVSRRLREFAIQFDRLSDVWLNCELPDCMLDLLKRNCDWRRDYRSNKGLEHYIDSLREMAALEPTSSEENYFSYERGVNSIQKEVELGAINSFERDRRCFIWLWETAYEATRYVFDDSINRLYFHHFADQILADQIPTDVEDSQDIAFRKKLFKKQADLLRAAVCNPF
jgi:hypothetical protein